MSSPAKRRSERLARRRSKAQDEARKERLFQAQFDNVFSSGFAVPGARDITPFRPAGHIGRMGDIGGNPFGPFDR